MKALRIFLLAFAAILIHTTILKLFAFGAFRPDLTIFVLVYISLKEGPLAGVWTGFCIGLLQDSYMPSALGVHALTKGLIGYLVGFFNERDWKVDLWVRAAILFLAFLFHDIIVFGLRHGTLRGTGESFVGHTLPAFAYTLLLWALAWQVVKRTGHSS